MLYQHYIEDVISIAQSAGMAIKDIYESGEFTELTKSDDTPVTSADLAAHKIIYDALSALTPDIPILSEEDADVLPESRQSWQQYWLVDPLDGTQEFISRSGDFAVIIALINQNKPVLGVVVSPISGDVYFASEGAGAFKRVAGKNRQIHTRKLPQGTNNLTLAVSRVQKTETLMKHFNQNYNYQLIPLGSAALKSCLIAEGLADCYMRIGPTGEWDTGATECIISEAGGAISTFSFEPLTYNRRDSLENPNFVVIGSPGEIWRQAIRAS